MNMSRGFAPLILIIIIGLAVLGGAGYYSIKQASKNPFVSQESASTTVVQDESDFHDVKVNGLSVPVTVEEISWSIEEANPNIVDENDYRRYEQAVAIDVTFADKSTKRYRLGTAYGCTGSTTESIQDGKKIFGRVNCYFSLTGVDYAAYSQDGRFMVERFEDDASGKTNGKTTVVLKI